MQGVRIIWPRVCWVYLILALVLFNITCAIVGCTPAQASELPIPVQTIIGECANCTDEDMIAIGNVLRNRAQYRHQTVQKVALAPKQFSCWNAGRRALGAFINKQPQGVIDRAYTAWQVSGTEDITFGADHYFADYIREPSWVSKMVSVRTIGRHRFYRAL